MAPITHVVTFELKADTSDDEIKRIAEETLVQKNTCLHPETKKPYLKSLVGGKGTAMDPINGVQGDTLLVFIIEFNNEDDRQFFVEKDVVHKQFIEKNISHMAKAQVLPFSPGVF